MNYINKKGLRLSFNLCKKGRKSKNITILNHKNMTKHIKSVI